MKMHITMETTLNFGKYKGCVVGEELFEGYPATNMAYHDASKMMRYLWWVKDETSHTLDEKVIDRMRELFQAREAVDVSPDYSSKRYSRGGRLEHYNDMGAMNDISFGDVYGTFGY